MEEDEPTTISIPAPVNSASVANEDLDDIQVPIEDVGFHRVSIVESIDESIDESIEPEQKESHVCIFPNCKKGKRGGTEYCIKHKKMGVEEREKLAAKLSKVKKQRKVTKPKNVTKSVSQKATTEEEVLVENVKFSIDKPAPIYVNHLGLSLVLLAFFQMMFAFEKGSDDLCWLSGICFVVGTLLIVFDSPSPVIAFVYFSGAVIAYSLLIMYLFEASYGGSGMGGGGVGGLSEWGGP